MDLPSSRVIKCHKCRNILIDDTVTTVINEKYKCDLQKCSSYNPNNFLFLSEDKLPEWIYAKIEAEQWTKGKLLCAQCGCKVGSFDYVSGRKCDCKESILPPVYFVASQVDRPINLTSIGVIVP